MTEQVKQEGLWRNCEDSIRHALEHFSAGASEVESFHHHRGALLSVAQAAEFYGNLLLCRFNPKHPEQGRYLSLRSVHKALKDHPCLSPTERCVFEEVLATLADRRDPLMHRLAPENPEELGIAEAAIALLSLLHIVRGREGLATKEFFDQDPPVEQDIRDHMGLRDHERWFRVAEALVKSEYRDECLSGCDNYGSFAVAADAPCQACFHEAQH